MLQTVMVKCASILVCFLQCVGSARAEVITGAQHHELLQSLVCYLELHFQRTIYISRCVGNLFDATVWRDCILFRFFSGREREVYILSHDDLFVRHREM
jgi:hypothetical protein